RPFLHSYLVCPVDKGELEVDKFTVKKVVVSEEQKDEIIRLGLSPDQFEEAWLDGLLLNPRLKLMYPIYRGVPRLLVFQHPLLDSFRQDFGEKIEGYEAKGYSFPDDDSVPGERSVLASFSSEWTDYGFNEDAYWGQEADAYNQSLYDTLHND